MKKFLIFFTLLVSASANAQMMYNEGEKWGLLFQSGQTALKAEYDRIQLVYCYHSTAYICAKNGTYGFYYLGDSTFTGCIYDSVFTDFQDNVLLEKNGKYGFIGYNEETKRIVIIEQVYDQVNVMMHNTTQFDSAHNEISEWLGVEVRKDSLWGVVDFADGSVKIPIQYNNRVEPSGNNPGYFMCIDRENLTETLIEPFTGMTYKLHWPSTTYLYPEWNLLYTVGHVSIEENSLREIIVFNFTTGEQLWSYTSNADEIHVTLESPSIVHIEEDYDNNLKPALIGSADHSFHNITNGAVLLKYHCSNAAYVETVSESNKLIIYATDPFAHKKKEAKRHQIGEIYL